MFTQIKRNVICNSFIFSTLTAFMLSAIGPMPNVWAQELQLPVPGTMVNVSKHFAPAVLTGIKINPDNPLEFDFLIRPGDKSLSGNLKQEEYMKLVKYFMAAVTMPEKDMWVNLSPYEGNRILPTDFAQTEVGRDLLAQDYMLKQLTASLIHPEKELGKAFWNKVYTRAQKEFGTAQVPVSTFNKVWIVPQKATVYENGHTAMVTESHLKVMLEEDYLAMTKNSVIASGSKQSLSAMSSQVLREVIIPAIEKEVNEGETFAQLRQIYNAVILSAWFKTRLKESILGKVYVDQAKTNGIALDDPKQNQKIFDRYVQAYKKGVYSFIKEDVNPINAQLIPRKYFSGGASLAMMSTAVLAIISLLPGSEIKALKRYPGEELKVILNQSSDSEHSMSQLRKAMEELQKEELFLPVFIKDRETQEVIHGLFQWINGLTGDEKGKDFGPNKALDLGPGLINGGLVKKSNAELTQVRWRDRRVEPTDPIDIDLAIVDEQGEGKNWGKNGKFWLTQWTWSNEIVIRFDFNILDGIRANLPELLAKIITILMRDQMRAKMDVGQAGAFIIFLASYAKSRGLSGNNIHALLGALQIDSRKSSENESKAMVTEQELDADRGNANMRLLNKNLANYRESASPAMRTENRLEYGGIDMNNQLGTIQFQGQKVNFVVPKGFEYLLKEPVNGFVPRIQEIRSGTWDTLPFFSEMRDNNKPLAVAKT